VSLFLPGVGSMVNGSAGMGIAILVTWIVGVATAWLGVGLVVIAGAWVWGVVDGALSADRWNRAHGIIS
jgi:TM2 domain-containing membrane protein YozV